MARRTIDIDSQISGINRHVHFIRLWQNHDRNGGGLNAPLRFCFWYSLDTVDAAFIFERLPGVLAFKRKHDLLETAQLRLVRFQNFTGKAMALGVHGIHPIKIPAEKGGLFPTDPGTDLNDDVLPVVGITGQ